MGKLSNLLVGLGLPLLVKSHVKGYTRSDGTAVAEHDDKRQKAAPAPGGEHPNVNTAGNGNNDPLIVGLRALGHTVSTGAQSSGISTVIRRTTGGTSVLTGGADPRREGIALGDTN